MVYVFSSILFYFSHSFSMLTSYMAADRHTDKELAGETGSEISSNTHNAEVAREELNKSHGGTYNIYQ